MNCTRCGSKVATCDTRATENENYRMRKCKECGAVFYTVEKFEEDTENFIKKWRSLYRKKRGYKRTDCFAYHDGKCAVMSELICKDRKCSFYKPKGTQYDTCHLKSEAGCKYCVNNNTCKARG